MNRTIIQLLLILFAAFQTSPSSAQEIDWKKYCAGNGRNVLLFVDITTPYDSRDKSILVEGLQRIVSELQGGDRIVIRTIADSASHSERLIDRCIPYCPELGFWESLFSNCTGGLILNHKRILIAGIRDTAQAKLDNFQELPHSDVIATITRGSREEVQSEKQFQLFVFSDLIENSEFIQGGDFLSKPNAELLQKVKSAQLLPPLSGAVVRVFGVGRGGHADRTPLSVDRLNKVIDFWNALFNQAGVSSVSIAQNLTVQ